MVGLHYFSMNFKNLKAGGHCMCNILNFNCQIVAVT
jgi:hypothetical protein